MTSSACYKAIYNLHEINIEITRQYHSMNIIAEIACILLVHDN